MAICNVCEEVGRVVDVTGVAEGAVDVIADVAITEGINDGIDDDVLLVEGAILREVCARVGPVVAAVIGADDGLIEEVAAVVEIDVTVNEILAPLDVPRKDCDDDDAPAVIMRATRKDSCSGMFELCFR